MKIESNTRLNKKDLLINMCWLLAIILGILSIPISMVMIGRAQNLHFISPEEMNFVVEEKTFFSFTGYLCTIPEHTVRCVLPTPDSIAGK